MGPVEIFTQFGLPGVVIGYLFFWIWRQEKRMKDLQEACRKEADARVGDAKQYSALAIEMERSMNASMEAWADKIRQEEQHSSNMRQLIEVLSGKATNKPEDDGGGK